MKLEFNKIEFYLGKFYGTNGIYIILLKFKNNPENSLFF